MVYRFWLLSCVCGGLALSGCETGDPSGATQAETGRAVTGAPTSVPGSIRLGPRSTWVRLNPMGPALYSPKISPDGRWVAAAAKGGLGLYLLDARGRAPLQAVDPSRQGPWAWTSRPAVLHFGGDGTPLRVYDPDRQLVSTRGALTPWVRAWEEELGELLLDGPLGRWFHHPRRGTVTLVPAGQRPRIVADEDAWGAVVSPEGRYVAFSKGLLADSRFFIHDAQRGHTRELGPGVHPVWLPVGGAVIYAVPAGVERGPGISNVTGAELWLFDFSSGGHRALTATLDLAEMEPALGPGGDSLVWTDWQRGGLWRAPLLGGGAP